MPKGYEKMADTFAKKMKGKGKTKRAKAKAARIWNAEHPENPVTRKHGKKSRKAKG